MDCILFAIVQCTPGFAFAYRWRDLEVYLPVVVAFKRLDASSVRDFRSHLLKLRTLKDP